jgi:SOS regulatory protein LexA
MKDYLQKLSGFYREHKRMPSYAEIMKLVGFKSKNAVYKLVNKLVEEGFIAKDETGRIIPKKLFDLPEVPLLGLVEAGFPSVAEEEVLDTMSIDEYLIDKRDATYLLEVKGDSMIDAGIQEGDMVIAERGKEPKIGDIVIAEFDGGWTMKYYRKQGSTVYLEPANKHYKPLYPKEDLKIAAVVKGVIRKY